MFRHIGAVLISVVALSIPLSAGAATLEQILQSSSGTSAKFVHRFLAKGFRNEQVEQGTVVFGAVPSMRWTYTSPDPKLFIFNGKTSWLYSPDEKQVTISQLTEQQRQNLPFLMFSDPKKVRANYNVREKAGRELTETTLTAKRKDSAVQKIVIQTSSRDRLLRRLEYHDRSGNRTRFDFSGHSRQAVPANAFTFVPPAGVEVLRN